MRCRLRSVTPDNPRLSQHVDDARRLAVAAHGVQKYGEQPYSAHLDAVAELLSPFGPETQIVGYLHDVVEDTPISLDRIRYEFGELVAQCVALVTDEPGARRKERKALTHAKLAKVEGAARLALIVKAADRLANLRASAVPGPESKLAMYQREHSAFREAVFRPGLCDEMWAEMEQLIGAST